MFSGMVITPKYVMQLQTGKTLLAREIKKCDLFLIRVQSMHCVTTVQYCPRIQNITMALLHYDKSCNKFDKQSKSEP